MDSDFSCVTTITLDCRVHNQQVEAIEHFVPLRLARMIDRAERLIRRYRVVDPAFGADDAVQDALLKLCQAVKNGRTYSIETEAELTKLLRCMLGQHVLDERSRENRRKRGGSGASPDARATTVQLVGAELDEIVSRAIPADEQVIAEDEVEWLLGLLDLHGPSLRVVAARKAEGFTHQEIADQLGKSLSVVKREVRLIKAILEGRDPASIEKNAES